MSKPKAAVNIIFVFLRPENSLLPNVTQIWSTQHTKRFLEILCDLPQKLKIERNEVIKLHLHVKYNQYASHYFVLNCNRKIILPMCLPILSSGE